MKGSMKQWSVLTALMCVAAIPCMVLMGEENPERPCSMTVLFGAKLISAAVLYLCYRAGRWLDRKGLMPEIEDE